MGRCAEHPQCRKTDPACPAHCYRGARGRVMTAGTTTRVPAAHGATVTYAHVAYPRSSGSDSPRWAHVSTAGESCGDNAGQGRSTMTQDHAGNVMQTQHRVGSSVNSRRGRVHPPWRDGFQLAIHPLSRTMSGLEVFRANVEGRVFLDARLDTCAGLVHAGHVVVERLAAQCVYRSCGLDQATKM